MALLAYFFIFGLQQLVLGWECESERTPPQEQTLKRLIEDLFHCGYTGIVPPKGPNSEKINVTVRFIMKYFSIDANENVLNLQPWTFMFWTDDRLKWDPVNYESLEEIVVESSYLWTPMFRIHNSADSYEDLDKYNTFPCTLKHNGEVVCVKRTSHTLFCDIKLSDFPYDAQQCSFVYGLYGADSGFNATFGSRAMSMLGADYGSSWFISDYKQQVHYVPDARLNITLVIEREAESLAAIIMYPALIITSLSIGCLFLDARLNERLMFTCFCVFSHCFWLTQLAANLPKLSGDPPRILLYYRGSLVVTVFILLLTFFLSVLCRKVSTPHNIIVFINKLVYGNPVRFLMYPRWEVPDDDKFNEDWTKFANSINSLCIIAIGFSYIGLYIAFVPQPIPFN